MSAQTPRNPNRSVPIHQRSSSQPQAPLTIRVVPFTPPRLVSGERAPSQASSHAHAREGSFGDHGDRARDGEKAPQPSERDEDGDMRSDSPGYALSSSSASTLQLANSKGQAVSGATPASTDPGRPRTTPVHQEPSEVTNVTNIAAINAPSLSSPYPVRHDAPGEFPSPSSSSTALPIRPLSRNRNYVAVHSDKTFSLVRQGPPSSIPSEASRSLISPPLSYSSRTSVSSTHEGLSIGAWSEDRPSFGTDTTILDRSFSPNRSTRTTPSPGSSTTQLVADPVASTSSPWNYRMVGGLRKVPKTPDLKHKGSDHQLSSTSQPSTPLPPLPEISVSQVVETPTRTVQAKASFASTGTDSSSVFETTNYEIFGPATSPAQVSSDSLAPPSSSTGSNTNFVVIGESSPVVPGEPSPVNPSYSSRPQTSDSNANYVVLGASSPAPALQLPLPQDPRATYSQESLRVAPLRPGKKSSVESLGYYKQRSRENLRARTGSLKSIQSFSSIISQEAVQAFFAAPILLDIPNLSHPASRGSSSRQQQDSWATLPPPGSSGSNTNSGFRSQPHQRLQMLSSTPHQWSSQLSTVMSESEGSSSRANSRSISGISSNNGNSSGGHARRSSGGWANSLHSRQLPSISSSLAQLEDEEMGSGRSGSLSLSRSPSVERPYPTYSRASPSYARLVRDQDEHGDGLTDLAQISAKPSKSGLSGFFSSTESSGRGLHSRSSSRTNSLTSRANSITSSLPAWARVYYASGERRALGALSIAESGETGSRPGSSNIHGSPSPNTENFPMSLHTARKRPNQVHPPLGQRPFSDSASMDINVVPQNEAWGSTVIRTMKRKTSSIWSPHLRTDRRQSRYSIWEPPSVNWSADSGIMGKRNAQVMLFMVGFLFPFGMSFYSFEITVTAN